MTEFADPRFVGEGRLKLVDGLINLFDQVSADRAPVWVSLEAPTGAGKTRIAHEFYSRLAKTRQANPPYWPPMMIEDQQEESHIVSETEWRRKRAFPESFNRPANSEPAWFWWGISCAHRSGTPIQALTEDLRQLALHEPFVKKSSAKNKPSSRKLHDSVHAIASGTASAGGGDLVSYAIGSIIPITGLLMFAGKVIARAGSNEVHHRKRASQNERVDFGQNAKQAEGLVTEVASKITAATSYGFPMIIYVEDLHWSDSQTVDLLCKILLGNSSVFVLTTAWPGELADKYTAAHRLLERIPSERVFRFDLSGSPARPPFNPDASIGTLGEKDLTDILHHYLPLLDRTSATLVVKRYPNPLALAVLSTLNRFQGATTITSDELETSPPQIEDLYRESWFELPVPVRLLLSLAAFITPKVISEKWGFNDERWAIDTIIEVLENSPELSGQFPDKSNSLDVTAQDTGWAADLGKKLRRFNEPIMLNIALRYGESDFPREFSIVSFRKRIGDILSRNQETLDWSREQWRDRLIVALASEQVTAINTVAFDAISRIATQMYVTGGESSDLRELSKLGWAWVQSIAPVNSTEYLQLLRFLIQSTLRAGDYQEAGLLIQELEQLSAHDVALVVGAKLLGVRYAYDLEQFGDSLIRAETFLDSQMQNLLSRNDLRYLKKLRALSLTGLYRFEESLEQLQMLCNDVNSDVEEDERLLFEYQKAMASAYRRMARLDDAFVTLREVQFGQDRLLGTSHPDYLATLQTLGAVFRDRGQLHLADELFTHLYGERCRVLGEMHRDSIMAEGHIAWLRRHQGNLIDSERLTRKVLAMRMELEGANSSDVIGTMHNLGQILRMKGDYGESREWLTRSLEMRTASIGINSRSALLTRKEIAVLDATQGDFSRAIDGITSVNEELKLSVGTRFLDVPNNEILRCLFAVQSMSGNAQERLNALRMAVMELSRSIGPEHPEVIRGWVYYLNAVVSNDAHLEIQINLDTLTQQATRIMDSDHPYLVQLYDAISKIKDRRRQ